LTQALQSAPMAGVMDDWRTDFRSYLDDPE